MLKRFPVFPLLFLGLLLFARDVHACQSMEKRLSKKWSVSGYELKADVQQGLKEAMIKAIDDMFLNTAIQFNRDHTFTSSWKSQAANGTWSLNKKEKLITTMSELKEDGSIRILELRKKTMTIEMLTKEGMAIVFYMVAE